jgi:hypothetical protein
LFAPAIILGTPCYSWRLYPKMLNGAHKNLSNLIMNCVTYLQDTILEVASKPQIVFEGKAQTDEKAKFKCLKCTKVRSV